MHYFILDTFKFERVQFECTLCQCWSGIVHLYHIGQVLRVESNHLFPIMTHWESIGYCNFHKDEE